MKANQKFTQADEAVSPVIGVILMVAITVVLAAVVFVLVSDLGGDSSATPSMSFQKDEGNNLLRVVSSGEADWADISGTISGTDCQVTSDITNTVTLDEAGTATGAMASASEDVAAGDTISFADNADGDLDTAGECTLTLSYVPSNSLLGSWSINV